MNFVLLSCNHQNSRFRKGLGHFNKQDCSYVSAVCSKVTNKYYLLTSEETRHWRGNSCGISRSCSPPSRWRCRRPPPGCCSCRGRPLRQWPAGPGPRMSRGWPGLPSGSRSSSWCPAPPLRWWWTRWSCSARNWFLLLHRWTVAYLKIECHNFGFLHP